MPWLTHAVCGRTWETSESQEATIETNEMRMLMSMCSLIKKDNTLNQQREIQKYHKRPHDEVSGTQHLYSE